MPKAVVLVSEGMPPEMEPLLTARGWRAVRRETLTAADREAVRAIVHTGVGLLEPGFLSALPALGLIANVSVGYDGVDVAWCRSHGIEVSHAAALNAEDVADHALGLLIGSWRNIVTADRVVRDGGWRDDPRIRSAPALRGLKLGIVGLGAIGQAVAIRAEAFGLQVAWWGPRDKPAAWPRAESLLALARDSDILMVACRADAHNRGLIGAEAIAAVGPRGLIVNVARGSLIDETALIAALRDGRLGRAALDVFIEEPLSLADWADVPNTVLTTHTAGHTTDAIPRMLAQAAENVALFLAGEPVATPVPQVA